MIKAWWIGFCKRLAASSRQFTPLAYVLMTGLLVLVVMLSTSVLGNPAYKHTLKVTLMGTVIIALLSGLAVFFQSYLDERKRNPTGRRLEVGSPLAWALDFGVVTVIGIGVVLASASGIITACHALLKVLRC